MSSPSDTRRPRRSSLCQRELDPTVSVVEQDGGVSTPTIAAASRVKEKLTPTTGAASRIQEYVQVKESVEDSGASAS